MKNFLIDKKYFIKDLTEYIGHVRVNQQVKIRINCNQVFKDGVKVRLETSDNQINIQNNQSVVLNNAVYFENLRFDKSSGRGIMSHF